MTNAKKAIGGKARALKLSPERLKEIAQQAAKARWKNHQRKDRVPTKTIRGVLNKRHLKVVIQSHFTNVKLARIEIIENDKVIRKFPEQNLEQARARMDGYVSALQDLGIEVEIEIIEVKDLLEL